MTTIDYKTPSHSVQSKAKPKAHDPCCGCPACRGLECLERPRFFAGQLLTEAELNSEQAYVIAKNRLHNRYLHGWGVVCGLAVVCACKGHVRVTSGYAIDPCGNDIIVCKDTDFALLDAIQACIDARKRRDDDCPPWQDPNADCVEDEEHWCVTIEYKETEGRPITPLRQESSCSCGCGGAKKASTSPSSGGCSCGGGCGDKPAPKPARSAGPACEPTRVFEQFRLGVIPQPAECAQKHETRFPRRFAIEQPAELGGTYDKGLPKADLSSFVLSAAEGTFLSVFRDVYVEALDFMNDRLSKDDLGIVRQMWDAYSQMASPGSEQKNGSKPIVEMETDTHASVYTACCHFRKALVALYNDNPLNVRCDGFDCPPCQQDAADPTESFFCLIEVFLAYVIDAVCLKLLPPCPPSPCDDRLILACVTVHKGKILHICNFSCRHYAGSFNTLAYWASLGNVLSTLKEAVSFLCCSPKALKDIIGWIAERDQ